MPACGQRHQPPFGSTTTTPLIGRQHPALLCGALLCFGASASSEPYCKRLESFEGLVPCVFCPTSRVDTFFCSGGLLQVSAQIISALDLSKDKLDQIGRSIAYLADDVRRSRIEGSSTSNLDVVVGQVRRREGAASVAVRR